MKQWLRQKAIAWLTRDIIKVPDSLVKITKNGWYLGDEKITAEQARKLSNDAQVFQDSLLWRSIKSAVEAHAIQKGLRESQSSEDQVTAKTLIYWTELVDKELQRLSKS